MKNPEIYTTTQANQGTPAGSPIMQKKPSMPIFGSTQKPKCFHTTLEVWGVQTDLIAEYLVRPWCHYYDIEILDLYTVAGESVDLDEDATMELTRLLFRKENPSLNKIPIKTRRLS